MENFVIFQIVVFGSNCLCHYNTLCSACVYIYICIYIYRERERMLSIDTLYIIVNIIEHYITSLTRYVF